ncbi:DUF3231 family protein [Virgibacillus alimentarius]|uniref:DUF3231 family protein n=1 Tax=Virgibacillus alimentarius TaxID=698769 RepID=UPI00068EE261|nr:DUF3231 family protein [Virgibacillus alimentarius]
MHDRKVRLTSGEIASLWTAYMNNSMSKYILKFMLKYIEDQDIKPIIQKTYNNASKSMEDLASIFENEQYAIPNGFTEKDVNMNASWLFSDTFCLTYVNHMAKVGMIAYSGFISMSNREDICDFFSIGLTETNNTYNESLKLALYKGISARHPFIETPKHTDYVDSKKYLSGLNPFSDKRPVNAVEISHLYMNILTNAVGAKLCLAFAQTSTNKDVQDYMLRGKEISQKHMKIFVDTLMKDNVDVPQVPNVTISNSTTPTFSDKLIMFHMNLIISSGTGNYSTAASASQRSDLMVNYERLSFEVMRLAKNKEKN